MKRYGYVIRFNNGKFMKGKGSIAEPCDFEDCRVFTEKRFANSSINHIPWALRKLDPLVLRVDIDLHGH